MSSLVIVKGSGKGEVFELPTDGDTVIGRVSSCDFSIFDRRMSRRHCVVTPGPEGYTIKDLGSSNGVTINGKKVPEAILQDGDRVLLGETELDFFVADAISDAETEMLAKDQVLAAVDEVKSGDGEPPDVKNEPPAACAQEQSGPAGKDDVLDPVPAPTRSETALVDSDESDAATGKPDTSGPQEDAPEAVESPDPEPADAPQAAPETEIAEAEEVVDEPQEVVELAEMAGEVDEPEEIVDLAEAAEEIVEPGEDDRSG